MQDGITIFDFPITAAQAVNDIELDDATPSGNALVTFHAESGLAKWSINYDGLTGPPVAMHFHGPALAGEATGVDLGIGEFDDSSSVGSAILTADQEDLLTTGFWYLNIHTGANGGGEIRGQVEQRPDLVIFDFPVDTDQVVNALELDGATPEGSALVTFDPLTRRLMWVITYEGLTGAPTKMHFHGRAAAGQATGVDLGIGTFDENGSEGAATLTAEQADSLMGGLWYLNIHTAANGAGEIRGQVVREPGVYATSFPISVDQVVNDLDVVGATPCGKGVVTYRADSNLLKWHATFAGLTGSPTKMHFHGPAMPGEATGVDLGIGDFDDDSSSGSAVLSAEQAADMRTGFWYLNIHTAANPAGEIRGQVPAQEGISAFEFPLTPAQAVNDVVGLDSSFGFGSRINPRGDALVTFNSRSNLLEWSINYSGLTGPPSAMHFHGPAAPGVATGVDLGISVFDESSSLGSAIITDEQEVLLTTGLWYLNIHTATNRAGEIRGQVISEVLDGMAEQVDFGTAFEGNTYNGFQMTGPTATFASNAGEITRVSFLDPDGDLVFAEFGSDDPNTTLRVDLEDFQGDVLPPYRQPGITYSQGLASFTIENSTALTFFSVFSLGNDPSRIDAGLIKSDSFSGDVDGIADIRSITIAAPATEIGAINAANANFIASDGIIGIDAEDVEVGLFLFIGDITPSVSAQPRIRVSAQSTITEILISGGDLAEATGNRQIDTNGVIYAFPIAASDGQRSISDSDLRPDIDNGSLDAVLDTFFDDIDAFFQTDGQSVIAIVPEQ